MIKREDIVCDYTGISREDAHVIKHMIPECGISARDLVSKVSLVFGSRTALLVLVYCGLSDNRCLFIAELTASALAENFNSYVNAADDDRVTCTASEAAVAFGTVARIRRMLRSVPVKSFGIHSAVETMLMFIVEKSTIGHEAAMAKICELVVDNLEAYEAANKETN